MKRFFITFSFILISLLSFIPNSYALTEDEELHLDHFTSNYYDIDNYPKCIFSYDPGSIWTYSLFYCFSEETSSNVKYYVNTTNSMFSGLTLYKSSQTYQKINIQKTNSTGEFTLILNETTTTTSSSFLLHDILSNYYHNFDIYYSTEDKLYRTQNLFLNPTIYYYVSFNIPDNSTLEVKDDTGNILEPISDYKYSLTEGHYSYSVYKEGYYSKENIDFTVTSDSTINVELESKFNPNNMQSIFTQYYNYIRDLVNDLFPLENPLFLFVVTFIIGFSIMALIKKLVGGLF